ncbi:MAG: polyamine aminopropyltransferase [Bacteroidia bacterium]|nr:polyamine aminopropyltransferase [Bacteroidia bacterium]
MSQTSGETTDYSSRKVAILLTSVFIIAICGILYELLISSISSYFQGSSILHFSIVIGLFLSFMGVGSYLTKFLNRDLLGWFILFEILLSIVGGFSTFILYFAFSLTPYYYGVAFILLGFLGTMIGLEIPILTRIVRQYESLKDAMAKVLSFDYLGALIASVLFPLILLPSLGLMRTAFAIGMLNLMVAILNIWLFRTELQGYVRRLILCGVVMAVLLSGFIYSFQITGFFDRFLYQDEIMLSRQSAYQQIVVTKWNQDIRLFIDGNLQFSSRDEYRYHEPLVHIPMMLSMSRERILVLGGGDGFVARELLKYPEVKQIDLVDLDPEITKLGSLHPVFVRLNDSSLNHPKVHIFNEDAYKFVEKSSDFYDVVIIDLPDPNNTSLGKLYSREFYFLLRKRLSVGGVFVTQSTSPYFAPQAFWCIYRTIKEEFDQTIPYQVYVPSFGQWGFNLAINEPGKIRSEDGSFPQQAIAESHKYLDLYGAGKNLRFLNTETLPSIFSFDGDTREVEVEVNQLDNQVLIQYYEKSWDDWR